MSKLDFFAEEDRIAQDGIDDKKQNFAKDKDGVLKRIRVETEGYSEDN